MTTKIEERMLFLLLAPAVQEALFAVDERDLLRLLGETAEDSVENLDKAEAIVVRRVIQCLVANNVIELRRPAGAAAAHVVDNRLKGAAQEGFAEGRGERGSVQSTPPYTEDETYEQLQLPGMEDS